MVFRPEPLSSVATLSVVTGKMSLGSGRDGSVAAEDKPGCDVEGETQEE